LDPGPNLAKKESLRRIVSVIFKVGCEERRRNHSYPIPYLDAPVGIPSIDSTDNSAHPSCCRNQWRMNVARRWSLDFRKREREVLHTEVRGLHACKSVLGKFGCSGGFKWHTSVHCVAHLSRYRPSKPVTPRKYRIPFLCFLRVATPFTGNSKKVALRAARPSPTTFL